MPSKLVVLNFVITSLLVALCQTDYTQGQQPPHFVSPGDLDFGKLVKSTAHYADGHNQLQQFEKYETLLANYRQLFVKSLMNLNEVCSLLDYIDDSTSIGQEDRQSDWAYGQSKQTQKREIPITRMKEKRSIPTDENFIADTNLNNALFTETLASLCHRGDEDLESLGMAKRGAKIIGTKVKFHSWGGKRNDNAQKDRSNPKIVVRTPFNSWGGKRSDPSFLEMATNPKIVVRTPFHSWGGKRSDTFHEMPNY